MIRHPHSIKQLAQEIKVVTDRYWARQLSEVEAQKILKHWAVHEGNMLFKDGEYNPTIRKIVGKKRIDLVDKLLEEEEEEAS